jgi:branched-subunit amino acid aminotransferase/4-amino-4-deoxychorismate lyase
MVPGKPETDNKVTSVASDQDPWPWAEPALKERLERDPIGLLKERGIYLPESCPAPIVQEAVRIVSLLWLDGKIVPIEQFRIDPADEGLLFGRGVWESTRTIGGEPWLWPSHIDRLVRTAKLLYIEVAPERLPDSVQVTAFVRALTTQDVVVRLNVTAGRLKGTGLVWMTAALRPFPTAPFRLKSCRAPAMKGQPYLTWKTFQYATRLQLAKDAFAEGFDSALLLDENENLLEAASANIFVRLPEGWVTPPADGGLLPGTLRQRLLANPPLPIREQVIPRARLAEAREVFITNSNVGIVPVTQIDGQTFPLGTETREMVRSLPHEPVTDATYQLVVRGR